MKFSVAPESTNMIDSALFDFECTKKQTVINFLLNIYMSVVVLCLISANLIRLEENPVLLPSCQSESHSPEGIACQFGLWCVQCWCVVWYLGEGFGLLLHRHPYSWPWHLLCIMQQSGPSFYSWSMVLWVCVVGLSGMHGFLLGLGPLHHIVQHWLIVGMVYCWTGCWTYYWSGCWGIWSVLCPLGLAYCCIAWVCYMSYIEGHCSSVVLVLSPFREEGLSLPLLLKCILKGVGWLYPTEGTYAFNELLCLGDIHCMLLDIDIVCNEGWFHNNFQDAWGESFEEEGDCFSIICSVACLPG